MGNHRDDLDGMGPGPLDWARNLNVMINNTPLQYETLAKLNGEALNDNPPPSHYLQEPQQALHAFKDHEIRTLVNAIKAAADEWNPRPLRRDVISSIVQQFLRGEFK